MAKKAKISYEFKEGSLNTDIVPVRYAHINQPDEDYDRYSITVLLDHEAKSTADLFNKTLEFENTVREKNGLPSVEIPSNWTRNGKPNKDESGHWLITAQMGTKNKDGQDRKPRVANVYGDEKADVKIWGGDTAIVNFSLGVWVMGNEAGSKYFLSGVQQIKPGASTGGAPKFRDMSGAVAAAPAAVAADNPIYASPVDADEVEDDDGIPF